ncbi:ferric reductase-like transmembrane domain-containing protein [Cohnella caldifontis]|uniref:ferric reductase-like transmembrane domain-containing protein n=1 Tax=Cohnella caldifontis TaxID=3027471 RepID=UPI0023ED9390|nr:ferric reductase-like transmembrane domain-containing protein [Cohnella sp. YIM B05605]
MSEWLVHLPTWMIARTTGLIAYYLLFAGMFLGILYGTPSLKGTWKARIYTWHTRTQGAGMIFALAHVLVLVIDHYSPFSWSELLVPFSHPEHPITYGLGSLAFYGLLLVLLTSDFRTTLPKKLWLALHMLSYPIYFMALIHGIYNGTDTQTPAVFGGYIATAAALLIVTFYRASAESRARASRPLVAKTEHAREVRHP